MYIYHSIYMYIYLYITANWDGIFDDETDILVYTWSSGTAPCSDNVHPHKDPHSHLTDQTEWTHQGLAFPLDLPGMLDVRLKK